MKGVYYVYRKDSFINKNKPYMFNKEITEYDMKEAGFSLIREFKLLPTSKIEELYKKEKKERNIAIGLLMRDDPVFSSKMKQSFENARRLFFEYNNIIVDDIISIKKDAIFMNKKVDNTKFGEFIDFRKKNSYTSYIYLGKNIELYYSPSCLDIKGINDSKIKLHECYIIDFLKKYFRKCESETNTNIIDFTVRFIDKYKRKELSVGYYRTFDARSSIEVYTNNEIVLFNNYMECDKDDILIDYNYDNLLLKLVRIPL